MMWYDMSICKHVCVYIMWYGMSMYICIYVCMSHLDISHIYGGRHTRREWTGMKYSIILNN